MNRASEHPSLGKNVKPEKTAAIGHSGRFSLGVTYALARAMT
jgi:hypothetical protein